MTFKNYFLTAALMMMLAAFGPNVYDGHTINEHVEISSIEHTWQYTIELLKNIK